MSHTPAKYYCPPFALLKNQEGEVDTTRTIPNSFRKAESERAYQDAKDRALLIPLQHEEPIADFQHWTLIENRFPYDLIYKTHHMLIPKRTFADREDMTIAEQADLNQILTSLREQYEVVFENLGAKRSNSVLFHVHLAVNRDRSEVV